MIKSGQIEQKIAICRFRGENRPVRPEPAGPDFTNCSSIYLGNYLLFFQKFPWKNFPVECKKMEWDFLPFQLFPWAHQGQPVFNSIVNKFHFSLRICNGNVTQIQIGVGIFQRASQILDQLALVIINFLFALYIFHFLPVCPSRLLCACFKFRRQLKKLFPSVYPLVCLLDFAGFIFCYVQHSRKFFQIHIFPSSFGSTRQNFFQADSMFVCAQKVDKLKPNFKHLSICFFSGRGEKFPSPCRLSCDNLGVENLALLDGLTYSAITNKYTHNGRHTLVGHRRFVRAIIFRNKGQFLEQVGHAVDPILFHLVICLVGKFQLFGIYLRRAILVLVTLGNRSKQSFKLLTNFISHGFAIQNDGKSVRVSHLVLFHNYQFLSGF